MSKQHPRKKVADSRHRAAYLYELRRLDEQDGGDHSMEIIMDAARRHDADLLAYLSRRIGINYAEDGKHALFWLAGDEDTVPVALLLSAGGNANAAQQGAASPLMHAARRNRLAMARLLVQHDAIVGYTDANGDTAFSIAEESGHSEMVAYLQSILAIKP
jgi:ankyrin repeat protein